MNSDFLNILFSYLYKTYVNYCILRNWEFLPESTNGSDIDILVALEDISEFYELINHSVQQNGGFLVSFLPDKSCPRLCFIGKFTEYWGIQVDLHIGIVNFKGKEFLSLNDIVSSIQLHNNVKVLSENTGAIISFLKEILNHKHCREEYYYAIKRTIGNDPKNLEILSLRFGKEFAISLKESFKYPYTSEKIKDLSKLSQRGFLNINDYITYWIIKISKIVRINQKPGYTVAFLGTDGSGKSTLIDSISPVLNQSFHNSVYYEHLRPNYFPSLARLSGNKNVHIGPVTNPHGSASSGFIISLIRFLYYLLDYSIGFYMKIFPKKAFKSCVWIFDRYYYDYYFDQRRSLINLPKWIIRLGQALIPEPDIIICLGADTAIIHSRKPELPLSELERQVKALKKFSEKHKRAFWVDTGTTIEESCDAVLHHIVKVMAKRFEHVKLA